MSKSSSRLADTELMDPSLEKLVGAARQQTLAAFDRAVSNGEQDPVAQAGNYRRRLRDYSTWLRMETPAPEATELAGRLLDQHGMQPPADERRAFELAITQMLVDLYEEFLSHAR